MSLVSHKKNVICRRLNNLIFFVFFSVAKGQLISKCTFGVFTFFQKTNENKSFTTVSKSSKVEFVRLVFRRNVGLKKSFQICLTFRIQKSWKETRKYVTDKSKIIIVNKIKWEFRIFLSPLCAACLTGWAYRRRRPEL